MKYPTSIFSITAILLSTIPRTVTYSTGAPPEGCWSERPLHKDYLPQGGHQLPYRIALNTSSYGPRETVVVTIDSPEGIPHKGFLISVVTSSGLKGGRWAVDLTQQRYNVECGVTHNDARPRNITTVLWQAPSATVGDLGNIQFKAIVVANLTHFWDNILSHSLTPVYPDANLSTLRRYQRMFSALGSNIEVKSSQPAPATSIKSGAAAAPAATSSPQKKQLQQEQQQQQDQQPQQQQPADLTAPSPSNHSADTVSVSPRP